MPGVRFRSLMAVVATLVAAIAFAPGNGSPAAPATSPTAAESSPTAAAPDAVSTAAAPATTAPAQAQPGAGKRFVVVRIDEALLSRHGTVVLNRGIDYAYKKQADLVVVYLKTPGGKGSVMLGMRDAIVECKLPTLGYVREAYSAGALLALACDKIYMHPLANIGDAIPIMMLPTGQAQEIPEELKEKIVAPLISEFEATARYNGHSETLARAMVDREMDLPELGAPKGKILVLKAREAAEEGLAAGVFEELEDAVADMGYAGAERLDYRPAVADRLASFLSSPIALVVLIAVAIGGIVIEVKTPGFGLGGIVAIVAIFFFFWANWYANLAHWMEILLFVVGIGLIIGEIAAPGFGVLGISGIVCITVSLFLAMFRLPPEGFAFTFARVMPAVKTMIWAILVGVVGLFFAVQALSHSRLWQRVSLGDEMVAAKGFSGRPDFSDYVGREGTSLTSLRPVGSVRVDGKRFDAMTEGDFVDRGASVKVVRVDGAQLVVEPSGDETTS